MRTLQHFTTASKFFPLQIAWPLVMYTIFSSFWLRLWPVKTNWPLTNVIFSALSEAAGASLESEWPLEQWRFPHFWIPQAGRGAHAAVAADNATDQWFPPVRDDGVYGLATESFLSALKQPRLGWVRKSQPLFVWMLEWPHGEASKSSKCV